MDTNFQSGEWEGQSVRRLHPTRGHQRRRGRGPVDRLQSALQERRHHGQLVQTCRREGEVSAMNLWNYFFDIYFIFNIFHL